MVRLMPWICSAPLVSGPALIWISLKSRRAAWVRNGNPSIVTLGFCGKRYPVLGIGTGGEIRGYQQAQQDDHHDHEDHQRMAPAPGAGTGRELRSHGRRHGRLRGPLESAIISISLPFLTRCGRWAWLTVPGPISP
jgi:hypothetical protein